MTAQAARQTSSLSNIDLVIHDFDPDAGPGPHEHRRQIQNPVYTARDFLCRLEPA